MNAPRGIGHGGVDGVSRAEAVELSVVVPVFGCAGCLDALHERLRRALEKVTDSFEIVLVDDRSPDGAWSRIVELAQMDPAVRGLRLSRNFGQHLAITAGLAHSRGRWTVVMDCDLQEPPEAIPGLYAKAQEGYSIVHTRRAKTADSIVRTAAGRAYFRVRDFLLGTRTEGGHGTLSILASPVVDAFLRVGDRDREYLAVLNWLGFDQAYIEVERARREVGSSSYSMRRLLDVATGGLFFQTTIMLRWIVRLGFLVALAGAALAVYYVVVYFTSDPPSGFTSIAVLLLLLGGFVIVSLGVVGLYVGRTFEQVKGRPLWIVDEATDDRTPGEVVGKAAYADAELSKLSDV